MALKRKGSKFGFLLYIEISGYPAGIGREFLKWNLELHQGHKTPCRVMLILWIKCKQGFRPSFFFFCLVFFLQGEVFMDLQKDVAVVFIIRYTQLEFLIRNIFSCCSYAHCIWFPIILLKSASACSFFPQMFKFWGNNMAFSLIQKLVGIQY